MNGASDQPEEFGVQPEQGRQEEPQSNADSTSDATASPEDSTSSAPHSRRVRRRMSAEHIRQIKRKRRRRKILIGVLVVVAALAVFAGAFVWSALHVKNELQQAVSSAQGLQQTISEADTSKLEKQTTAFSDHVSKAYKQTSSPLWQVASVDIESVEQAEKADVAGNAGVKTVRAADKRDNASLDYAALFAGRSSVREYAETPVDMGTVRKAVSMSMKTPSVCNRQAYRVLLISNPKFIEQALALQGGWRGYDAPPVLALISVDVRSFVSVEERNEPYIDGGLFAMAFLTALECESLAACPLNTMMREKQEHEIRKLLGVPDYETLIAFVAIGNFPESIESPVSFRYDASVITRELN